MCDCLRITYIPFQTNNEQNRVYYTAYKNGPPTKGYTPQHLVRNGRPLHFFSIDKELLYWNFFLDFGPLNLAQLYRFCKKLNKLIEEKPNHTICYYSSADYAKRANATFLICAWQILFLDRTPEEALRGFRNTEDGNNALSSSHSSFRNASSAPLVSNSLTTCPLKPFHDASPCACTYDLSVLDCLQGLVKARRYGFFNFGTFNVAEYEHFEQVEVSFYKQIVTKKFDLVAHAKTFLFFLEWRFKLDHQRSDSGLCWSSLSSKLFTGGVLHTHT